MQMPWVAEFSERFRRVRDQRRERPAAERKGLSWLLINTWTSMEEARWGSRADESELLCPLIRNASEACGL